MICTVCTTRGGFELFSVIIVFTNQTKAAINEIAMNAPAMREARRRWAPLSATDMRYLVSR